MQVKRTLFIIFIIPILLAIGVAPAWAGVTGKVVGKVVDLSTNRPLPSANIIIEGTTMGAASDPTGYYMIINVPPGIYTLRASMMGYKEVRIENVRVSIDLTTTVNFELEPTVIEVKKAVTVIAKRPLVRPDLTSSQAIVGAEDIEKMPAEQYTDILQLKAGITTGRFGEAHIRGGRSSEIAYMIDGISVSDAFDGSPGVQVENSAIQELQVVSGTFNAEYGQAMSGLVNLVTKEGGTKYSGQLSAYSGDYVSTDTNTFLGIDRINPLANYSTQLSLSGPVPYIKDKLRFYIMARYFYNDGWLYGQRLFIPSGDSGDSKIVPMNFQKRTSSLTKFSYRMRPGLKLSYEYLGNNGRFRNYNHYFKYNPDGDYKRFKWSNNNLFTLTHAINSRTFYDLRLSRLFSAYKHYVYEDPLHPWVDSIYVNPSGDTVHVVEPGYVHPDLLTAPAYNFAHGGTEMNHFKRNTSTIIGKFDITSQVTRNHQIKSGLELRYYKLFYHSFNIYPKSGPEGEIVPFQPWIDSTTATINNNMYTHRPIEFAIYIQDKMEFKDMIVNAGIRYDYFNPDGKVLADPQDPDINNPFKPEHRNMSLEERQQIWYKRAKPKRQLSPRIGIAYPITDRGVMHFSYGHFLQIPSFQYLYDNPEFEVPPVAGVNTIIGNADLDAQRTAMYELGLQQQLSDYTGMDVTLFYRDIRNWVGTSPTIDTYIPGTAYSKYVNRDYANVRGITLSLNQRPIGYVSGSIDYTFQIAEGTASNPEDAYNDERANREPRKEVIPLAWDRTHTLNVSVILGTEEASLSIIGRYASGMPYTPQIIQGVQVGRTLAVGLKENSERKPNNFTLDLTAHKYFISGNLKYSLFTNIYNVLDKRNELDVFGNTGRATYSLEQRVAGADAAKDWFIRPDFYDPPRQVQIGVSIIF